MTTTEMVLIGMCYYITNIPLRTAGGLGLLPKNQRLAYLMNADIMTDRFSELLSFHIKEGGMQLFV